MEALASEANGAQRFYRESAKVAIPLGIAAAAAVATFSKAPQRVLSTMWISFAIVGTAAVIALSRCDAG